jgi:short-subunit dehydrogenase
MSVESINAVITGATGGIGAAVAKRLLAGGGKAVLTGRDSRALRDLVLETDPLRNSTLAVAADLTSAADRARLCDAAKTWQGGVNTLINIAGVAGFGMFAGENPDDFDRTFEVNALAPLHLTHALLPHLLSQPRAHIVNVGSVFGTIAYPGHAVYSATKFALRGFSEALRRELDGTNVVVHYLAPRSTRTSFNSSAVEALNERFGIAMDPPERVAATLLDMIEHHRPEAVIGWPEKLFARLNALVPRLVDRALAKQVPAMRQSIADRDSIPPRLKILSREVP